MKKNFLLIILLCVWSLSSAETVVFSENFDSGSINNNITKIKRYPDSPMVITPSPQIPGLFPIPSGNYVAANADKQKSFYGLGSIIVGPEIDLANSSSANTSIEAKLFLLPSSKPNENNVSLIALNDSGKIEQYYRFGYNSGKISFQFFSGSQFSQPIHDSAMGSKLKIPGWHTFKIRFSGANHANFYVDNIETSFSPMKLQNLTKIQAGALIFDQVSFNQLYADDFQIVNYGFSSLANQAVASNSTFNTPPAAVTDNSAQSPFLNSYESQGAPTTSASSAPAAASAKSSIQWYNDMNSAIQAANSSGKKILIYFYSPNMTKCSTFEQSVLSNPSVTANLSKFICVKINVDNDSTTAQKYSVFRLPSLILVNGGGQVFFEQKGYCESSDLNVLSNY